MKNDIIYTPPKMPKCFEKAINNFAQTAPFGRDGLYNSPYLKSRWERFPWKECGGEIPKLKDVSRWVITANKRGFKKVGRIKKQSCFIPPEIQSQIILDAETYGPIQDAFLGSPAFESLWHKYAEQHNIAEHEIAMILISQRKKTPSEKPGSIYAYRPSPTHIPNAVKFGFTEGDPHKRMDDATKNTRTELPEMISWYNGEKSEEGKVLKYFKDFRAKGNDNREMHQFDDLEVVREYFSQKIKEHEQRDFSL